MTEFDWKLLSATSDRLVRFAVTPDGYIHLQVWLYPENTHEGDAPTKKALSLTPDEYSKLGIAVAQAQAVPPPTPQ